MTNLYKLPTSKVDKTFINKKNNSSKRLATTLGLVLVVILGFSTITHASPVLNFSDINSGPKTGLNDGLGQGAIITVWGQNLGDIQEDSKIYIGNVEAAHVYYWGKADGNTATGPAELSTYHNMQTISFSIPATTADGLVSIHVEVDNQVSEALPFTVRDGDIFFVKPNGSNGAATDGTWDNPWGTLDYVALGRNNLGAGGRFKPGDILYATDGVVETDGLHVKYIHGTAELPLSIIAYPGAEVIVEDVSYRGIYNWNGMASYWNFSKLIIKTNGNGILGFKGMRAIANEITNYPGGCADGQGGAIAGSNLNGPNFAGGGIKMLGNYIHNFGCDSTSKLHHVFYISNRGGTMIESFEIGWNHVSDTKVHHALHVYDEGPCGGFSGTMKIHNNAVINQVGHGINIFSGGTTDPCFEMPIEIYNNLIVNSGMELVPLPANHIKHSRAIAITGDKIKSHVKLYHNTLYGYAEAGNSYGMRIQASGSPAWVFGGTWEFVNNIFVDIYGLPFEIPGDWDAPDVNGNNLWYSSASPTLATPPSWDTTFQTGDPGIAYFAAGDFVLKTNSAALNNGAGHTYSLVKRDIMGNLRNPSNMSIGAYESSPGLIFTNGFEP
ncbi:MAG: IPT/TIG domain-containing protein [Xanthomonadales bacterium]|nr:IPT/TIG domain-containing protein [Xanthomonadales bacterium]